MYHPSFNIGIEEEYQVVTPSANCWGMSRSRWRAKMVVNERAASAELADLVRSGTVGVGTPVCVDINEARDVAACAARCSTWRRRAASG